MATSKPTCLITARIAGPCCVCGARPEIIHFVTAEELDGEDRLYCEAHCPEKHPVKPISALHNPSTETTPLG
jgi:hypothetical protein